jgi:hypothetical protein
MCNYHPALYAWLGEHYLSDEADLVGSVLGSLGFTEVGIPYPLTAKYHMNLVGIPTENQARAKSPELLTDYARSCTEQMKRVTDDLELRLGIKRGMI